jgi:DNA modification methylase
MIKAYNDDCLNVKDIGEVHLTFTSPPYYNAMEYAHYNSYEAYLGFLKSVFALVYKHTVNGRFCAINTSPVIEARANRSQSSKRYAIPFDLNYVMQEIGWEFIDDIVWVKPMPSVKDRNAGFRRHRKPLAYKPNAVTEYIMVYRKKSDKLIDWNMKQYSDAVTKDSLVTGDYQQTNVWNVAPARSKKHPAVFPIYIAREVIKYYSYVGDTVFDPFAGIGTTGMACNQLNRNAILIEKDNGYYKTLCDSLNIDLNV